MIQPIDSDTPSTQLSVGRSSRHSQPPNKLDPSLTR